LEVGKKGRDQSMTRKQVTKVNMLGFFVGVHGF
jgi:hypothetical protein